MFSPVELSDPRCRGLWERSDIDALRVVAKYLPKVLPIEEWSQVVAHQPFIFGGPGAYRRFYMYRRDIDLPPTRVASEYWNHIAMPRFNCAAGQVTQFANNNAVSRVLDVGAWIGAEGIYLSNLLNPHDTIAGPTVFLRELSLLGGGGISQLLKEQARFPHRIVVEIGDHESPPLPSNCDVVYAGEVLEHVPDLRRFVSAVEVATRHKGLVIFSTPVETTPPPKNVERHHTRDLSAEDLTELFGKKREFKCCLVTVGDASTHVFWWEVEKDPTGRLTSPTGTINWRRKLGNWEFTPEELAKVPPWQEASA